MSWRRPISPRPAVRPLVRRERVLEVDWRLAVVNIAGWLFLLAMLAGVLLLSGCGASASAGQAPDPCRQAARHADAAFASYHEYLDELRVYVEGGDADADRARALVERIETQETAYREAYDRCRGAEPSTRTQAMRTPQGGDR